MVAEAHHGAMFVTDCQACGLRELRGPRSIELLAPTGHGMVLGYCCTRCGTRNVLDPAPAAQPVPATVAA